MSWIDEVDGVLRLSRLALMIILTVVKWIIAALCWQVALGCVGCWLGLADCMLTISTVSIVSMLSFIPAGLGIQEISLTAMLTALGHSHDTAQAGSLAVRLLLPVMVVLGLLHLPGVAWRQPLSVPEHG